MRAGVWVLVISALACMRTRDASPDGAPSPDAATVVADAPPDAPPDAAVPDARPADGRIDAAEIDPCLPGCHWDCAGGSFCLDGIVTLNGSGSRPCCGPGAPPSDAGLEFACAAAQQACKAGACIAPDPRYTACIKNSRYGYSSDCGEAACDHALLACAEHSPRLAGHPCAEDSDCRPAAEGASRLRCVEGICEPERRPVAPLDYGASCGLPADAEPELTGERLVFTLPYGGCRLCQVMRAGGGCLRQGCTVACAYDEDCPSGSVCLCAGPGSVATGYCAAATDRVTAEGRAAGLAACSN